MLDISIHALLAESDLPPHQQKRSNRISIHALLAESDLSNTVLFESPICISIHALLAESDGIGLVFLWWGVRFLSTLSLRRATHRKKRCCPWRSDFYPRSPCGERRTGKSTTAIFYLFLSTLSLRRATYNAAFYHCRYFISIHALLAESDGDEMESRADFRISIHALLAESDPRWVSASALPKAFLSTLSLRRATYKEKNIQKMP